MVPDKWRQSHSTDGKEILICPGPGVNSSDWQLRTKWLRSLHIDATDNHIISCGWPKFLNLNEGIEPLRISLDTLEQAINSGLWATLKEDGSLLIRFVQDGVVKFRTRGSLSLWMPNADEIPLLCQQYPRLLDPTLGAGCSLLFEWLSPTHQIVIRHKEPGLRFLGGVHYDAGVPWWAARPYLFDRKEILWYATALGIPPVNMHKIGSSDELNSMIVDLVTNESIEGYVLRFSNFQEMVKIKATPYLKKHAFRFKINKELVIGAWLDCGAKTVEEFQRYIEEVYDHECWLFVESAAKKLAEAQKVFDAIIAEVRRGIEYYKGRPRKDFATKYVQSGNFFPYEYPILFTMYDGGEPTHTQKCRWFDAVTGDLLCS